MPLPSASGLTRFRHCTASSILPQIRTTSKAAEDGSEIHLFMENAAKLGKEEALKSVSPELYGRCSKIDVEAILADYVSRDIEAAYALDPVRRTARKLGNSIGRDYEGAGKKPEEIGGSEDVIGVLKSGKHRVEDYKSGQYIGPAKDSSQLLYFASCLYLILDLSEVSGRITYIEEDGSHWHDDATWTAFDIEAYIDSLADACKRYDELETEYLAGRQLTVNQGDWCSYCNAMAACPAYTGLARRLVPELADIDQLLAALTPEQAGVAWGKYRQAKEVFERIETGLKEYARNVGITLPDGRTVGESTFKRRYLSTDKAVRLLGTLGATQKDIDSLYSTKEISTVRERKNKE